MSHEIFISYSTRDPLIAESICEHLEGRGIACWIAPRNVPAAMEWDLAILEAIEAANLILFILSSESNESKYVKRELMFAVSAGKVILPLRVENVQPSKNLRFSLLPHQWVDAFPPPLSGHFEKIAAEIRRAVDTVNCEVPVKPDPHDRQAVRDVVAPPESVVETVLTETGIAPLPPPQASPTLLSSPPTAEAQCPGDSLLRGFFAMVIISVLWMAVPVAVAGAIHGIAFGTDGESNPNLFSGEPETPAERVYHWIDSMVQRGTPGFQAGLFLGGAIGGLIALLNWFCYIATALRQRRPLGRVLDELMDGWDFSLLFVAGAVFILSLLTDTGHSWIVPILVAGVAWIVGGIVYRVSIHPKNLARQQRILGLLHKADEDV